MPHRQVVVQANHPGGWHDTSILVRKGTCVEIQHISGAWTSNPNNADSWVGPEGDARYVAKQGYLLHGAYESALLFKVGENGRPRKVGRHTTYVHADNDDGNLYFSINDDASDIYGVGFDDNAGELVVDVRWGKAPGATKVPSMKSVSLLRDIRALLLIITGLCLLGLTLFVYHQWFSAIAAKQIDHTPSVPELTTPAPCQCGCHQHDGDGSPINISVIGQRHTQINPAAAQQDNPTPETRPIVPQPVPVVPCCGTRAPKRALSAKLDFDTQQQPAIELILLVGRLLDAEVVFDPAAKQKFDQGAVVEDQLQGLTSGTALALILSQLDLAMQAELHDNRLQLFIGGDQLSSDPWPVGWPISQNRFQIVPSLKTTTSIRSTGRHSVSQTLIALGRKIPVPLLIGTPKFHDKGIHLEQIDVQLKRGTRQLSQVFDELSAQVPLSWAIRVDEVGAPFVWVTP